MNFKLNVLGRLSASAFLIAASTAVLTSCDDNDDRITTVTLAIVDDLPAELPSDAAVKSGSLTFTEINTGYVTELQLPQALDAQIAAGTYNIDGQKTVAYTGDDGRSIERTLRTAANQVVINEQSPVASLKWFFYNPEASLVFSEIFFTGTLNAKGTNGLFDTYLRIYNNTDSTIYADGLAIVESKFTNASTDQILTPANDPEQNFTVQTIYVIPGNGRDVAIEPGKSIKIVDQAIDWNEQVAGALNHTDADFEWYDETSSSSVKDTDNPDVPNLDKWFSYSATIWIPSNQCNRSYALVRFPEGMTAEQFLADNDGTYQYINTATGTEMTGKKCYLVKNEWIIDGVNLCPTEKWVKGALSTAIDMSYAAISDKNADKGRFGKKFVRKTAGTSASGNTVLMDTNDSAIDFEVK